MLTKPVDVRKSLWGYSTRKILSQITPVTDVQKVKTSMTKSNISEIKLHGILIKANIWIKYRQHHLYTHKHSVIRSLLGKASFEQYKLQLLLSDFFFFFQIIGRKLFGLTEESFETIPWVNCSPSSSLHTLFPLKLSNKWNKLIWLIT